MLCVTSLFQYYTRYASYKSTAKENMRKKLEKLPLLATRPLYIIHKCYLRLLHFPYHTIIDLRKQNPNTKTIKFQVSYKNDRGLNVRFSLCQWKNIIVELFIFVFTLHPCIRAWNSYFGVFVFVFLCPLYGGFSDLNRTLGLPESTCFRK